MLRACSASDTARIRAASVHMCSIVTCDHVLNVGSRPSVLCHSPSVVVVVVVLEEAAVVSAVVLAALTPISSPSAVLGTVPLRRSSAGTEYAAGRAHASYMSLVPWWTM